jgi:hypothetical protein
MVHDSWLKVRISGDLVVGLRAKYGRGVSKAVRGMIERDLGVEKKSDAGALVNKKVKDDSSDTVYVDGMPMTKKLNNEDPKMTWRERLELQKKEKDNK